ncbi:hypothetical protein [Pseudomonas sp. XWY-1]|uniref:hypothetical protein n=1 Tax=Pseudomonas sp. XWY-1 TaxID=2069256 RepID=UPI000CF4803B|nr:hypothetical protein [Pseudomonas sp. XWY-1]
MKEFLLARQSQVVSVLSPDDAERMLTSGDYLTVAPRLKPHGNAKRMRLMRRERLAAGWLSVKFWLSPDEAALVKAAKRSGETYVQLLVRLINERGLL